MESPEKKRVVPLSPHTEINLDVLDEYLARTNAQLKRCARDFMKEMNIELIEAETPPDDDLSKPKPQPPQP